MRSRYICTLPENKPSNKQLFYTIDVLDEAITKKKKVMFEYCSYDVDKQMHPRKREDGTVRQYIVSPYQLAATNGRYYLICNYVTVTVNEEDMFKWAVQYGDHAVVLERKSLRDRVYSALKQAVEMYGEEE